MRSDDAQMMRLDHQRHRRARTLREGKRENDSGVKLASDIEQRTDINRVFKDRILDSQVDFSLRELLGIARKEFYDLLVDLVKRKRQSKE